MHKAIKKTNQIIYDKIFSPDLKSQSPDYINRSPSSQLQKPIIQTSNDSDYTHKINITTRASILKPPLYPTATSGRLSTSNLSEIKNNSNLKSQESSNPPDQQILKTQHQRRLEQKLSSKNKLVINCNPSNHNSKNSKPEIEEHDRSTSANKRVSFDIDANNTPSTHRGKHCTSILKKNGKFTPQGSFTSIPNSNEEDSLSNKRNMKDYSIDCNNKEDEWTDSEDVIIRSKSEKEIFDIGKYLDYNIGSESDQKQARKVSKSQSEMKNQNIANHNNTLALSRMMKKKPVICKREFLPNDTIKNLKGDDKPYEEKCPQSKIDFRGTSDKKEWRKVRAFLPDRQNVQHDFNQESNNKNLQVKEKNCQLENESNTDIKKATLNEFNTRNKVLQTKNYINSKELLPNKIANKRHESTIQIRQWPQFQPKIEVQSPTKVDICQTPKFNSDINTDKFNKTGVFFDVNACQISKDYLSTNSCKNHFSETKLLKNNSNNFDLKRQKLNALNERFKTFNPNNTVGSSNNNKGKSLDPVNKKTITLKKNSLINVADNTQKRQLDKSVGSNKNQTHFPKFENNAALLTLNGTNSGKFFCAQQQKTEKVYDAYKDLNFINDKMLNNQGQYYMKGQMIKK